MPPSLVPSSRPSRAAVVLGPASVGQSSGTPAKDRTGGNHEDADTAPAPRTRHPADGGGREPREEQYATPLGNTARMHLHLTEDVALGPQEPIPTEVGFKIDGYDELDHAS